MTGSNPPIQDVEDEKLAKALERTADHNDSLFCEGEGPEAALMRQAANRLRSLSAENVELREALNWIAQFAYMRSEDDSKVFPRVCRGALRNISARAHDALAARLSSPVGVGNQGLSPARDHDLSAGVKLEGAAPTPHNSKED